MMRPAPALILTAVCALAALALSGCPYDGSAAGNASRTATGPDPGEMHDEQMPAHGHHEEGHGHEQAGHAHEPMDVDPATLQPSGELVDGVREIKLTARRYEFEPSPIVVKLGETVRIIARSEDVTHGLEIEGYDVEGRIDPGRDTTMEFTADKAGKFVAHCNVYCGPGHDTMYTTFVVQQ